MKRNILPQIICLCTTACLLTVMTGCKTDKTVSASTTPPSTTAAPAPAASKPTASAPATSPAATTHSSAAAVPATRGIIRIKAGSSSPITDSSGNVWQAEQGFVGGGVVDRDASTTIANTKDQNLFLSEHYSMESFSCNVPNGKYLAKLFLAETFEGIAGPGERVFSFNVQGHEFKDFDIWVKAGGPRRAYVETIPAEVTDGKLNITFTSKVENPAINAIELIPQ